VKNYNNADIEEIRREIYGDGSNNIENKNTNKISPPQTNFNINENESNLNKIDIKKNKPKWAMTKEESEKVNDKELDDLLNFAQNLDYEKYIKDLEIREALGIIKNKIENKIEDQNIDNNGEEIKELENKKNEKEELTLPPINNHNSKPLEHENDWNSSVKVGDNLKDDQLKYQAAEEVLKNNPALKGIHSNQSIKKILEREGLIQPTQSNLIINVHKERDGIHNYTYKPSVLPSLRDHPGV